MKKATVTFQDQEFILNTEAEKNSDTSQAPEVVNSVGGDFVPSNADRPDVQSPNKAHNFSTPIDISMNSAAEEKVSADMTKDPLAMYSPNKPQQHASEKVLNKEDTHSRHGELSTKDLVGLEKENARLRQENKRHQSTIQLLREDQVKSTQEIKSLRAVENRNQMEREKRMRLQERGAERHMEKENKLREAIQKECDELRERMNVEKANAVSAIGKWKEALEAERNRFMEGKRHIVSLQRLLEEEKERSISNSQEYEKNRKDLKDEIKRVAEMHSMVNAQLVKEKSELAQLQGDIERERSEKEMLQQNLQQDGKRRAEMEQNIENLELNIKIVKTERERLLLRLKDIEGDAQMKGSVIDELHEKINALREDTEHQGSQRRAAEEQLSKYKLSHQSQYEKLCEYHSEIAAFRARCEDLQREQNELLQTTTFKQDSLKRALEESKEKQSTLQQDNDERLASLQRIRGEHESTVNILEDTRAELQRKVHELNEMQSTYHREKNEWTISKDLHAHTAADLERKLRSLSEETQRQNQALQDVQSDFFEKKQEAQALREKNDSLNIELKSTREAHESASKELGLARTRLLELDNRVAFLTTSLADEQEKSSNYSQSTNDLDERLRRRESDLAALKEDARHTREELNGEIFELRTKLNKLGIIHESTKTEFANSVREKDVEINMLKEEKTHQTLQIKNLTHDLHDAKLENSKQNAAISAHLLHIDNLSTKITAQQESMEELRQQLQSQRDETERKEREGETLRYRMQEMEMRHDNYQKDLVLEVQNAREEANVALTNANELKHRIINLEDELNDAMNGQSKAAERHFAEIEAMRAERTVSQDHSKALEDKIDALSSSLRQRDVALSKSQQVLDDKDKDVEDLKAQIASAQKQYLKLQETLEEQKAAHASETARLDDNLQQVMNDQRSESRKVNALKKQLTDIEEEIEQQDSAFRHIEKTHLSKILELRNDLASSEKTNYALRNDLSVFVEQSKIEPVESADTVPRSKYERLKSDFQTVRAQNEEFQKTLADAEDKIARENITRETAQSAIDFIHRERAEHVAARSELSMCRAALQVVFDHIDNAKAAPNSQ